MTNTKEEMISDLYGLRAGISLISKKIDEKKQAHYEIDRQKNKIADNSCVRNAKEAYERALGEEQKLRMDHEYAKQAYEDALQEEKEKKGLSYEERIQYGEVKPKEDTPFGETYHNIVDVTRIVVAILIAIGLGVLVFISGDLQAWDVPIIIVIIVLLILSVISGAIGGVIGGFVIGTVVGFILAVLYYITIYPIMQSKKEQEEMLEKLKEKDRRFAKLLESRRENFYKTQQALEEWEKRIVKLKNTYKNTVQTENDKKENMKAMMTVYQQEEQTTIREIKELERRLELCYNQKIAKSDWENVDLLIHYLQTGRAESMKEALQLVDRQKQTDQIVRAIYDAGTYISGTIKNSVRQLGNALAQSFSVISMQLSDIQKGISDGNARLDTLTQVTAQSALLKAQAHRERSKQITMQIQATDLQNALLEKANVSSDEMVKELQNIQRELKRY